MKAQNPYHILREVASTKLLPLKDTEMKLHVRSRGFWHYEVSRTPLLQMERNCIPPRIVFNTPDVVQLLGLTDTTAEDLIAMVTKDSKSSNEQFVVFFTPTNSMKNMPWTYL